MSTTIGAIFTGNSQFASSLQQVVSNAVSLASLPLQQMEGEVTTLQSQSSELTTLSGDFTKLQSTISTLDSSLGVSSYAATSSDNTVATASLSGSPSSGTYSIEVDSVGAYASAMTGGGFTKVTDPTSTTVTDATSYTLTVGSSTYTITPAESTLSSLASAINSSSAGVTATVVNVGAQGSTDYRLSVTDSKMEDATIQLDANDGTMANIDMMDALTTGAPTTYRVNGVPASDSDPLSASTPDITVAPGLTVALAGVGTTTISVKQNTTSVSTALASFVSAYNTVETEVNSNRGKGTGALKGDSILSTLAETLQQITTYSNGTSGISSLTSLGLSFDSSGVLSFDTTQFSTATQSQMASLQSFLGSTSTGGFLKSANDSLNALTDSISGVFQTTATTLATSITNENTLISNKTTQIDNLQTSLNAQMAAADTAISGLEQQYSYLAQMMAQMQTNASSGIA